MFGDCRQDHAKGGGIAEPKTLGKKPEHPTLTKLYEIIRQAKEKDHLRVADKHVKYGSKRLDFEEVVKFFYSDAVPQGNKEMVLLMIENALMIWEDKKKEE